MTLRPHSRRMAAMILSVTVLAGSASAQIVVPQAPQQESFPRLGPEELEQLVGPIALYPDPMIAQILPASTYPLDIVKAARMLRAGATPFQTDAQDWDPSVKAVAHYPGVIDMMDTSIDWTQQLGQAFMAQPDDVMQAIQRLRIQAANLGNLVSTPQQQVLIDDDAVRIFPANPGVICLPVYDPAFVFYRRPARTGAFINFSIGFVVGGWLDLDCDWRAHNCYRPGWTWDHWRDNIVIEREHVIRVVRPVEAHRGEGPPGVWRRDARRPLVLPGKHITRPSAFDSFRGRDGGQKPRMNQSPRPMETDRGREHIPPPRQPTHAFDPRQPETQTRKFSARGTESRQSLQAHPPHPSLSPLPPAHVSPPPAAAPHVPSKVAPARPAAPKPTPAPSRPQSPSPRPQASPAARITPPPVKIAPPPRAAAAPSRPPLTTGGPAAERGANDRKPH